MSDCHRAYFTISKKEENTVLGILLGEKEDDSRTMATSEEFDKYLKEALLKSSAGVVV